MLVKIQGPDHHERDDDRITTVVTAAVDREMERMTCFNVRSRSFNVFHDGFQNVLIKSRSNVHAKTPVQRSGSAHGSAKLSQSASKWSERRRHLEEERTGVIKIMRC